MSKVLASKLITPDGTVLQSFFRHDYKSHIDANGDEYILDGGHDYIRRSYNKERGQYISVTTDDTHDVIREHFSWGTRGKDGNQPLQYKPLKSLDVDHIKAILETQTHIADHIKTVFEDELDWRNTK